MQTDDELTTEQRAMFETALRSTPRSTKDALLEPQTLSDDAAADAAAAAAAAADKTEDPVAAASTDRPVKVAFSSAALPSTALKDAAAATDAYVPRETVRAARLSRRSSLTDDRVDEVITNLTNMQSMVKLLRAGSVDKPDASRSWDDLAQDLEDEQTARIIAEEAATANQRRAEDALSESDALRVQLALIMQQLQAQQHPEVRPQASDAGTEAGSAHAAVHISASQQLDMADEQTAPALVQIMQLQQRVAAQQQEVEQLRREQRDASASHGVVDVSSASQEAGVANQKASAAVAEAAELQELLQQSRQQLQELQDEEKVSKQQQVKSLTEQKEAYESQIAQLQEQRDSEASSAAQHASEVVSLTQLRQSLEAELQSVIEQLQEQEQGSNSSKAKYELMQAQHASASEQLTSTQEQLSELQLRYDSCHAQHAIERTQLVTAHQTEVQELRQQVTSQQSVLSTGEASQQEDAAPSADQQHFREQLAAQQARVQELESALSSAQQAAGLKPGEEEHHWQARKAQVENLLKQQLACQHVQIHELESKVKSMQQAAAQAVEEEEQRRQANNAQVSTELKHQLAAQQAKTLELETGLAAAQEQAALKHEDDEQQQQQQLKQLLATQQARVEDLETELEQRVAAQQAQCEEEKQHQHPETNETQSQLKQQLAAQKLKTQELEAELRQVQQLLVFHAETSKHTAIAPAEADSNSQDEQQDAACVPNLASNTAQPDLATAREALSPATTSSGVGRLPDQASAGVSAFQARLHSMLPQLPALRNLEQLSSEVGRLEGLESEVDQLQHVLQSVAVELESGQQQAQAMQRRSAAAEHALKKAELRLRGAELRAESAEAELAHLRKQHAVKHSSSPWRNPGTKPWSPKASPRASPPHLPGFESRLLEPEDMPHDASDSPTSSSSLYHHASSSSQQHVTLPLQHKPAALSSFKLTAKQRYAPTAHSSAASAQHMTSSSSQQAAAQHSSSNAAQRMTSSSPQQAQHAGDSNLLQATAQQGGSGAAELLEAADRPSNAPSDQPLHKLGSYRISDLELDEEDGLAASTDTAGADAADVASVDGSDHQDCSKKQAARKFQVKPRTANGGKAAAVQALPTTTHLLRQKAPPNSRFSSPARSLPPHLRSYRNFTQTALLDSGSLPTQRSGSESARQSSAGLQLPTLHETGGKQRSAKTKVRKGRPRPQARSVSARPDYRPSSCDHDMLPEGHATSRITYGMEPAFAAARRQYEEASASDRFELTEHDRTQNWLKDLTVNKAKQASDPKLVDQNVYQLQQVMLEHGLKLPFKKIGPCQYKLGMHKLRLKVSSNKLLVRCGAGYDDLLCVMEKMAVCNESL